eukprot:7713680-Heterocapsa_arctica.AAC.1
MTTFGQGGKGKEKKGGHMGYTMGPAMYANGKYSQGTQKGGHSTEDAEHQEIKKDIAKLQQVEHTLTDMGESEESIAN